MKKFLIIILLFEFGISQGAGDALDFDGSNDYVLIPYDNSFNVTNLTIEAWVYSGNFNQNGFIFEKGPLNQQYSFFFEGDALTFRSKHSGTENSLVVTSSGIPFASNTWHHIAATYDGTTKRIYVDGNQEAQVSRSGTLTTNSTGSIIGAYYNEVFPNYYFNGKIDDVRIWNDTRTASEIQEYMHKEVPSDASGLVAYYKMSNGTGTSLTDNSSNSNTGTLTNMDNSDWVTSYAVIGDLGSSYKTDVEGIWSVSGTSESDASNGLTMTVGSALTAGNFAVFGNNNTNATSTSDLGSVASTVRTGRIWQVDESGTVSATIKIDMSDATGTYSTGSNASSYILLYRSGTSGAFSSAATGASISGDVVTFNNVSLQDGYYALGANNNDASLPVELTSFELLETRNDGITLQWVTESEINNLGFNLDRKTPITDWSQIASYVTHPALQGQGSVSHQTIYTFIDNTVQENESYDYRLSDVDYDGNVEYHSLQLMGVSSSNVPEQFVLYPNYPNPFNPVTTIRYDLSKESFVGITIYDMLGNVVHNLVNANESPGYKSVQWNATNNQGDPVSAGVYLYKIQAGDFVDTKKMILVK